MVFCVGAALTPLHAQRELLPASDPVYDFLFRQELKGSIRGFSRGMLPLSRLEVAAFLDSLKNAPLTAVDRALLVDYKRRLSYDIFNSLEHSSSLLPDFKVDGLFENRKQKYLYASADSTATVFLDGFAWLSYRAGNGDSTGTVHATLGEVGLRLRGTLMNRVGFFIQASNGMLLEGSHDFALRDQRLQVTSQFKNGEKKFFDFTSGYLRYDVDWLAVTAGREQLLWGMGYSDRMVFSNNAMPFDYFRIDLKSGNVRYAFLHGSLGGTDSTGRIASSKYIASHRVEFNAGRRLRIGISEAVLYANQPPLFALMNPMAFLTSAELSTEAVPSPDGQTDNAHNSIIWLDAEVTPVRNVRLAGTWLLDDFSWAALGESSLAGNTNKFGWQAGAQWNDAFTLDGLLLSLEYTRIGPFVQSHWTRVNSYTHWEQPLGHGLQPNSDDWTLEARLNISARLRVVSKVQFQRTGENIRDADGRIVYDAGSDVLHGESALLHPNVFLDGLSVKRMIGAVTVSWQPIWQYILDIAFYANVTNVPAQDLHLTDLMLWTTLRVEY